MRGQASAIYLFVITLIGLGIGPTAVALVTDYVFQDDMAVRYSIFWVASVITIGAVVLLWLGIKPYREARETLAAWRARHEQNACCIHPFLSAPEAECHA